ncbi:hypothetical protein [Bergeyella zoohelcum]|uniref:Uncharacterized protein n=1 Tax=Bergeyella zoohelcum ATCC 43767 TaxID=883096 RepID=K1LR43_9FLAO|nr:hypothetical protein [Bergeyella zoohelcum]EKB59465.1 hypothetical protein HMPREF9699_00401 [Bergeyella zoohelcum ATCC 43767]SUV49422.1 Uncharacterised protein [Bergeyella zoohelcum]
MKNKLFFILTIGCLLTSCSKKALKCDDVAVIKTAAEIAKEEFDTSITPSFKNIRTIGQNKELKSCECEAEISILGEKIDVAYTAEYTTDGNIYVNFFSFDKDFLDLFKE